MIDRQEEQGLVEKQKAKYEALLEKAKAQCEQLELQLSKAMEGNTDEQAKIWIAEIEKLKKEVKDLEEEIEDQEDETQDWKKKSQKKDDEIKELLEALENTKKSLRISEEELQQHKKELEEKSRDLNLKIGALTFVQELLSAKPLSNADNRRLNKHIYAIEEFVKGQFTELSASLFDDYKLYWENSQGEEAFKQYRNFFFEAFEQWAATKRKSWLDQKTTIAFVGEFSAGKTSIVNRLLSQDDKNVFLLPVSTKATTAIPTYIAGGNTTSYSFVTGDGKQKVISENTFKKISKEVLEQVKGISTLIKYFVMTYKNPNLNGLSILDTPGFNSNDSEDGERTVEVINECDALFWVFDVNVGDINKTSIKIIQEKLTKPLFVVINKIDTKASTEVDKTEAYIKKTLANNGIKVQGFIRFSEKAPLEDIMTPIGNVRKDMLRDTYLYKVGEALTYVEKELLQRLKQQESKYNKLYEEKDKLEANFFRLLNALKEQCEEAASIPHWETHVFSKDCYEMSESEGQHLIGLLSMIAEEQVIHLFNCATQHSETSEEYSRAYEKFLQLKSDWQKVDSCQKYFKKIVQEFEKNNGTSFI